MARARSYWARPAIWLLAGVAIIALAGLWLVLTRQPASIEHAAPVATPAAEAPAPMPRPRPAT